MKKLLPLIGLSAVLLACVFLFGSKPEVLGGGNSPTFLVASSTVWTIGPTVAVNVAPTSTSRLYVRIQNTGGQDATVSYTKAVAVGSGERLSFASGTAPIVIDQEHLFTGSVWAISAATTTINVTEFAHLY